MMKPKMYLTNTIRFSALVFFSVACGMPGLMPPEGAEADTTLTSTPDSASLTPPDDVSNRDAAETADSAPVSTAGGDTTNINTNTNTTTSDTTTTATGAAPVDTADILPDTDATNNDDTEDVNVVDPNSPVQAGQLTAGEWRDLDNWEFWDELLGMANEEWSRAAEHWNLYTRHRLPVVVTASDNSPITDAAVALFLGEELVWEARTDHMGRAELFPGLFTDELFEHEEGYEDSEEDTDTDAEEDIYIIAVTAGENVVQMPVAEWESTSPVVIQLPDVAPRSNLDLMFVIDSTGSMEDELQYLKAEMRDILRRLQEQNDPALAIRASVNFYRDEGDAYEVRAFPFTENAELTIQNLTAQFADGGGDFPEAVHLALDNAVSAHQWSPSAKSRLLFLLADARAHRRADDIESIHSSIRKAAALGIRIIPVVSSGADIETEFFMRFIDVVTGGTYLFLTDDSGIGAGHATPRIGKYEPALLHDLLIRIINESVI
jgi:hypothetical protein